MKGMFAKIARSAMLLSSVLLLAACGGDGGGGGDKAPVADAAVGGRTTA